MTDPRMSKTALALASILVLAPLCDLKASVEALDTSPNSRVNAMINTTCQGERVAELSSTDQGSSTPGDTPDPSAASSTLSPASTDSGNPPGTAQSASPSPSVAPTVTFDQRPIRGPGVFVVPAPSVSGVLTPPPVPTAEVTAIPSAGPAYLSRDTPGPEQTPVSSTPNQPVSNAPQPLGSSLGANPSSSSPPSLLPTPVPASAFGHHIGHPAVAVHPTPSAATPVPVATLGPNQIAILADTVTGGSRLDMPGDASGNVHVYYREGVLIGDHAHYDGVRYITVTGHTSIQNGNHDTRLSADSIVFDLQTNHAILHDGKGATSRGVQQGLIHYQAHKLDATSDGRIVGEHASFSTCENPRGGYHISARTLTVIPGQKLVAKAATVFLGGLAIFFIPVLEVPLSTATGTRRQTVFAPELGYDTADGFYVKARLGFGSKATYYGYYRVEEYTNRGLGLGYVAFIGSRNGRRNVKVDFYDFHNKSDGSQNDNLNLQDQEVLGKHLQGQFGGSYTSEYGPYVSLPPSYSINGTVTHSGKKSTQTYSFSHTATGSSQATINGAIQDTYQFSSAVNEALGLNYTANTNSYAGVTTPTSSLHINSLTHASTHNADYTMTIDQTDSATPSGYNKVPEFVFHPHAGRGLIPFDTQLTVGTYHELTSSTNSDGTTIPGREAQRSELDMTAGPAVFRVLHSSTLSATLGASQYYYSTGDLKAQTRQTLNLTSPIGTHVSNVIQYQEQNLAGPQSLPFQYLDVLGAATHNAQDTLSISNGGIYTFTLSTGTAFDHVAQPISYQLIARPSTRSYLSLGGSYDPGAGNGFSGTNVQISTPFGRNQSLEFTSNIDWKNHAKINNKNVYFRKIVGNCYDVRLSYNQDLKAVNLSLDLLAFPSQGVNFGFVGQQQAIFPQNFVL